MCPLCEDCPTWTLARKCGYFRFAYLFDNPGTVFYAILMSFWGLDSSIELNHFKLIF